MISVKVVVLQRTYKFCMLNSIVSILSFSYQAAAKKAALQDACIVPLCSLAMSSHGQPQKRLQQQQCQK
ncbi:hypothetical protein HaLaN_06719, partial [Haematococcus lacustris]